MDSFSWMSRKRQQWSLNWPCCCCNNDGSLMQPSSLYAMGGSVLLSATALALRALHKRSWLASPGVKRGANRCVEASCSITTLDNTREGKMTHTCALKITRQCPSWLVPAILYSSRQHRCSCSTTRCSTFYSNHASLRHRGCLVKLWSRWKHTAMHCRSSTRHCW